MRPSLGHTLLALAVATAVVLKWLLISNVRASVVGSRLLACVVALLAGVGVVAAIVVINGWR